MDSPIKITDLMRHIATGRQKEYIEAFDNTGNIAASARLLGVTRASMKDSLRSLVNKAAKMDPAMHLVDGGVAPDGYTIKGVSQYHHATKSGPGYWVKTQVDPARQAELMSVVLAALAEDLPKIVAPDAPIDFQDDVIPWLQIGDAHLGMLAHSAEIGENFDLKIAEQELCTAISILISELPPCERMVINDLGDFTHYENFQGVTEASGHALDFDSRFPKMIHVYIRVMEFIINTALAKAKFVDVIINQGNHSRTNDIWMAELIRIVYSATGRVNVLNNGTAFIAYRMGNTLVMTHHSDKCRPNRLAQVMMTDFRRDYGETRFHYIDIGHIHHGMVLKEHPGVVIESFNHLAALDKWAHDSGWRNRKSITIILRSKTYGEVGRRLLPIEEVRDRMVKSNKYIPTDKKAFTVPMLLKNKIPKK